MKFKNLSIKKFRGIKKLEIEDLSRINLFLGKNNSGKTSILETIFMLTGLNLPFLSMNIDIFRNLAHNDENDFRFLFYKLNYNQTPEIKAELFEREAYQKLTISPKGLSNKITSSPTRTKDLNTDDISTESALVEKVEGLIFHGEIKKFQKSLQSYTSSLNSTKGVKGEFLLNSESDKKFKSEFNAIFQHANYINANENQKRLEKVIIERKKSHLITALKTIDPKIEDIALGLNGVIFVDINADRFLPINLMGDGILKVLGVVTNMNEVKNGILLIDEIDNGLHYTSQKSLWKVILELSKENNIQLFITSHSKDAIKYLKEIVEESKDETDKDLIRCYTIIKNNDDVVNSYKYTFDSLEFAIEKDIEIRGEN